VVDIDIERPPSAPLSAATVVSPAEPHTIKFSVADDAVEELKVLHTKCIILLIKPPSSKN
jgi:hypothetical protein